MGKPLPRDKILELDTETRFYELYDVDKTEEGEEAETIVIHDSILVESKQNHVKRKFPYINTFDHEGPAGVSTMRNITIGVFEHLKTTSPMLVDQRISYMQHILRGAAL